MPETEKQQLLDSFQKALLEIRKGNIDLAHTLFEGLGEGVSLKDANKNFAEGLSFYGRAAVNLRRSSLTEAENLVKQAFTIFEELEEKIFSIKSNNILGLIYLDRGQYDKALQIFNYNMQEAKEGNFVEEMTIAHNNCGYCLILQGKYSEARKSFQIGLELAIRHGFEQLEIGCYENLVLIARRTGDYREAQRLLKIAREKSELQENEYYLMNVFHAMAAVAMDQGDYNSASTYFEKSLSLARKNKINRRLAQVLGDLGSLYHRVLELDKSLSYFEQSIELYEKYEIGDDIVEKLTAYAEALVSADKITDATSVLNKAADQATVHDSQADHAQLSFTMGLVQLYKGRYGLAKYFFRNTLHYLESANLAGPIMVRTHISLASLSLLPENGQYPVEAFNHVRAAYIAARDQNLYPLLVDVLLIQALLRLLHERKFDEAEVILQDALKVAVEKGFLTDIIRIEKRIKTIRSQRLIYEAYSAEERGNMFDELTKQDVLYEINRLAYNKEEIVRKESLNPEKVFIFTVKQAEKGPRFHIGANLPEASEVPDRTFIKAGIIYSLALGSGHDYHYGFYGPFPFDKERKYTSLVYSTRIYDEEADERLESKNFVLLCLVYPAEYRNVAYDLSSMEKTVEKYLDKWQDISDIRETDLNELRLEILKAFHNINGSA